MEVVFETENPHPLYGRKNTLLWRSHVPVCGRFGFPLCQQCRDIWCKAPFSNVLLLVAKAI